MHDSNGTINPQSILCPCMVGLVMKQAIPHILNDEIHFISTPSTVNLNAHLHVMLTPKNQYSQICRPEGSNELSVVY